MCSQRHLKHAVRNRYLRRAGVPRFCPYRGSSGRLLRVQFENEIITAVRYIGSIDIDNFSLKVDLFVDACGGLGGIDKETAKTDKQKQRYYYCCDTKTLDKGILYFFSFSSHRKIIHHENISYSSFLKKFIFQLAYLLYHIISY